jgi:diacylglycerol kinase (ATP)
MPAILAEVACRSHLHATVEIDGARYEDEWLLVAVANGNAYGSGFRIAPQAQCDDGLLDVILVGATTRVDMLRSLWLAKQGRHLDHPKVQMVRGRKIRIRTDVEAPIVVDGDVNLRTPVEIEVVPGAALLWK